MKPLSIECPNFFMHNKLILVRVVRKNGHFLNPPTQSICWRNIWMVPYLEQWVNIYIEGAFTYFWSAFFHNINFYSILIRFGNYLAKLQVPENMNAASKWIWTLWEIPFQLHFAFIGLQYVLGAKSFNMRNVPIHIQSLFSCTVKKMALD